MDKGISGLEQTGGIVVASLSRLLGRLGYAKEDALEGLADVLTAQADREDVTGLVVDMDETSFISSVLISVFLRVHKRLAEKDGGFAVSGLEPHLGDLFASTGLDDVFRVFPSRDEAVEALSASAQ